jgi:hypothetical protein
LFGLDDVPLVALLLDAPSFLALSMPWHPRDPVDLPSYSQIQSDIANAFDVIPCIGQIKAAVFQMQKKTDFVFISGTGSGKTLTFWIPMLYKMGSITILVTALNVLGRQMRHSRYVNKQGVSLPGHTARVHVFP